MLLEVVRVIAVLLFCVALPLDFSLFSLLGKVQISKVSFFLAGLPWEE